MTKTTAAMRTVVPKSSLSTAAAATPKTAISGRKPNQKERMLPGAVDGVGGDEKDEAELGEFGGLEADGTEGEPAASTVDLAAEGRDKDSGEQADGEDHEERGGTPEERRPFAFGVAEKDAVVHPPNEGHDGDGDESVDGVFVVEGLSEPVGGGIRNAGLSALDHHKSDAQKRCGDQQQKLIESERERRDDEARAAAIGMRATVTRNQRG